MEEVIVRENSVRTAPESNRKLTRASARAKKVSISKLCEIAAVASLGQINNIGNDRAQKFKKECSWEQWLINVLQQARAKKVGDSELHEMEQVASFGAIKDQNRARKKLES